MPNTLKPHSNECPDDFTPLSTQLICHCLAFLKIQNKLVEELVIN